MSELNQYGGVVIPMITPFQDNGKIDTPSLKRLLDYFIGAGTIPFILGTTGESVSITSTMRRQLVAQVVEFTEKRSKIYVGLADTCMANSLKQAETYAKLGADIFVLHPPAYYPLTALQTKKYFNDVADRLPGKLILYNIPVTTKISIPLEVVNELSVHPNIIGLKDSERSVDRIDLLAQMFAPRNDFALFSGWTTKSMHALRSGFDGIVPSTGNLLPHLFFQLYQAVREGNTERAGQLQNQIDPLANFHQEGIILSEVIAILKLMMDYFDLCGPAVLPPLTRLGKQREEQIRAKMTTFDFGDIRKYITELV